MQDLARPFQRKTDLSRLVFQLALCKRYERASFLLATAGTNGNGEVHRAMPGRLLALTIGGRRRIIRPLRSDHLLTFFAATLLSYYRSKFKLLFRVLCKVAYIHFMYTLVNFLYHLSIM